MKTAIWGWNPPLYQKYESGKYMVIYNPTEFEETITRIDHETEEETTETITRWRVWYEEKNLPEITELLKKEDIIEANKLMLKEIITLYDNSQAINECFITYQGHTLSYWANKSERNDLKDALNDCIAMGRPEYRLDLRGLNISISISCDKLLAMLSALEVYAIDCYNKTTDHIYAVNNLTTIEEIENYDYRTGYPEKLTFDI